MYYQVVKGKCSLVGSSLCKVAKEEEEIAVGLIEGEKKQGRAASW